MSGRSGTTPLLTVTNRVDLDDRSQDEVCELTEDGQRRTFGRDDIACDIVVWSALNGARLARVAGVVWRMDDELWVRNLSDKHELRVEVPDRAGDQLLRRRRGPDDRGDACSIPGPLAFVTGPDGLLLEVQQTHRPPAETFTFGLDEPTLSRVPPVPDVMRSLAVALCAPMLRGSRLPATYAELMQALGEPSMKVMRRRVAELCAVYTDALPDFAARVEQRRRRQEAALAPPTAAVRRAGGVTVFETSSEAVAERARSRALALPDYFEVAQLLVDHFRVTVADVEAVR